MTDQLQKGVEGAGGALKSGATSVPGLSQATGVASQGAGKAQQGAGAAGSGVKEITTPIPVVGNVVEGVGNAPTVQKLGGKDSEQQGYLSAAYSYAGSAARTVYDAAGNAIGTVGATASSYVHGSVDESKKNVEDKNVRTEDESRQSEAVKQ